MRTGEYCISNIDKLVEEGCISPRRAVELKKWQEFRDKNPRIRSLTEEACKPLMSEKNPVVQAEVLESTGKQLSRGSKPTGVQMKNRIANSAAGKDNQGGDHKGAQKEAPKVELSDFIGEAETDPEGVYPFTGNEVEDTGDIPSTPNVIAPPLEAAPDVIPEPGEIEEKGEQEEIVEFNTEITAKTIKENLINAGHVEPPPKPERVPTEGEKQDMFDACVAQAYKWGMEGGEIARRMRKAIIFAGAAEKGGE